jgi:hypothetical protein
MDLAPFRWRSGVVSLVSVEGFGVDAEGMKPRSMAVLNPSLARLRGELSEMPIPSIPRSVAIFLITDMTDRADVIS